MLAQRVVSEGETQGPEALSLLPERAPSEGWGGCGQVPFLLAERAR